MSERSRGNGGGQETTAAVWAAVSGMTGGDAWLRRAEPRTPVEIRAGNLLAPLIDTGERFRAIVSNPPYLSAAEYEDLDPSVSRHEPREALVSGADGLDATRALFAGAAALLEPGGLLALEIDERRAAAVRALGTCDGWNVALHADLFGRPRYALSIKEG